MLELELMLLSLLPACPFDRLSNDVMSILAADDVIETEFHSESNKLVIVFCLSPDAWLRWWHGARAVRLMREPDRRRAAAANEKIFQKLCRQHQKVIEHAVECVVELDNDLTA